MNKLILAIGLPVAALFVFVYTVFALATPRPESSKASVPLFTACNTDGTIDGKFIAVSADVSPCGYAIELVIAGTVVKGSIDAVVTSAPANTAQIWYVHDGKIASAVVSPAK